MVTRQIDLGGTARSPDDVRLLHGLGLSFAEAFAALLRLYMTLDVGHAQLLTKQNTAPDLIDRFLDRIKHIHVYDNRGGDSPEDDLHLPLGQGILDFKDMACRRRHPRCLAVGTLESCWGVPWSLPWVYGL